VHNPLGDTQPSSFYCGEVRIKDYIVFADMHLVARLVTGIPHRNCLQPFPEMAVSTVLLDVFRSLQYQTVAGRSARAGIVKRLVVFGNIGKISPFTYSISLLPRFVLLKPVEIVILTSLLLLPLQEARPFQGGYGHPSRKEELRKRPLQPFPGLLRRAALHRTPLPSR